MKEDILKGLKETSKGGLQCTDKEAMDRQKGVIAAVLRELTTTLLKGLTISHISLPIKIFEARSAIERIVDYWAFAPRYLGKAAKTSDHLERFKLVISFALSSLYLCTR